jgi:uncharacterized protein
VSGTDDDLTTVLTETESWNLLSSTTLGRLITSMDGQPDIFPVNYVVQHRTVLFRSAWGTKLFAAATNAHVAFEADDHDVSEGWSVIVKGRAAVLSTRAEIAEAERGQLLPWIPTVDFRYVRVTVSEITGRHFAFGPSPRQSITDAPVPEPSEPPNRASPRWPRLRAAWF